jgi:hypothetical protein
MLPNTQRPPCHHRATRPTSPTPGGLSSSRCLARPIVKVAVAAGDERRLLLPAIRLLVADAPAGVPYTRQILYYHFRKWRLDGRLRRAHDRPREAVRKRRKGATGTLERGRDRDSQVVLDHLGGRPGVWLRRRQAPLRRQVPHILVYTNGLVSWARSLFLGSTAKLSGARKRGRRYRGRVERCENWYGCRRR